MNIQKIKEILRVDMEIKNYKELCLLLGIKVQAGNTKRSQLKELARYVKFQREGQKFIIDEVYDDPKEKVDNRGVANEFSDIIQKLLMDILAKNVKEKNEVSLLLGKTKLLEEVCLVSVNYGYCKSHQDKLASYINMENNFVKEFYEYNHKNLQRNLETALNKLQQKKWISWSTTWAIMVEKVSPKTNELGEIKLSDIDYENYSYNSRNKERIQYDVFTEFREATEKEVEILLQCQTDVMQKMGFKNEQNIYNAGRYLEYMKSVNKLMHQRANVLVAYKAYKIICNREYIVEQYNEISNMEINDIERVITQKLLNNKVIDKILTNAKIRRDKTLNEIFGKPKDGNKKAQISDLYLENNRKLLDMLINKSATNIKSKVKDTKIKRGNYIGSNEYMGLSEAE